MDQYARKSEFVRRRALDLHRSGESSREIARMLNIGATTVQTWVNATKPRPASSHIDKMEVMRWLEPELPMLAFVPHIKLTDKSKYRMRSAA